MRNVHLLIASLVLACLSVGCSHATATLRGRHTAANVSVYGADGALATGYMAASYEQTASYAEAYAQCQIAGTCWQSFGGLGSDMELNYANTGSVGVARGNSVSSDDSGNAGNEDACAREMAADALRGVRSIDRGESVQLKGASSCRKGGAQ